MASIEVEIDIFSGLPNPAWRLSMIQGNALVEKLVALPGTNRKVSITDGLGYRGIRVSASGLTLYADIARLRVFKGLVHLIDHPAQWCLIDDNRALEKWLLATGAKHIPDDLKSEMPP